jgi:hypothetical protein
MSAPAVSGSALDMSGCDVYGSFEQLALVERDNGTNEGDQVRGVNGPPACLCGVDQLVDYGNSGCP